MDERRIQRLTVEFNVDLSGLRRGFEEALAATRTFQRDFAAAMAASTGTAGAAAGAAAGAIAIPVRVDTSRLQSDLDSTRTIIARAREELTRPLTSGANGGLFDATGLAERTGLSQVFNNLTDDANRAAASVVRAQERIAAGAMEAGEQLNRFRRSATGAVWLEVHLRYQTDYQLFEREMRRRATALRINVPINPELTTDARMALLNSVSALPLNVDLTPAQRSIRDYFDNETVFLRAVPAIEMDSINALIERPPTIPIVGDLEPLTQSLTQARYALTELRNEFQQPLWANEQGQLFEADGLAERTGLTAVFGQLITQSDAARDSVTRAVRDITEEAVRAGDQLERFKNFAGMAAVINVRWQHHYNLRALEQQLLRQAQEIRAEVPLIPFIRQDDWREFEASLPDTLVRVQVETSELDAAIDRIGGMGDTLNQALSSQFTGGDTANLLATLALLRSGAMQPPIDGGRARVVPDAPSGDPAISGPGSRPPVTNSPSVTVPTYQVGDALVTASPGYRFHVNRLRDAAANTPPGSPEWRNYEEARAAAGMQPDGNVPRPPPPPAPPPPSAAAAGGAGGNLPPVVAGLGDIGGDNEPGRRGGMSGAFKTLADDIGKAAKNLASLVLGMFGLQSLLGPLEAVFAGLGVAVAGISAPMWGLIAAITAFVGLFVAANWDRVVEFFDWFQTRATEVLGPRMQSLVETASGFWDELKEPFRALGEVVFPILRYFGELVIRTLDAIGAAIEGFISALGGLISFIKNVFTLQWGDAWADVRGIVADVVDTIFEIFAAFFPELLDGVRGWWDGIIEIISGRGGQAAEAVTAWSGGVLATFGAMPAQIEAFAQQIYEGVEKWLGEKFGEIVDFVGEKVGEVVGFFRDAWDAVVGNSYVPDMVDGIQEHFGRLKTVMVDPAKAACAEVIDAYDEMFASVTSAFPSDGEIDPATAGAVVRSSGDNEQRDPTTGERIGSSVGGRIKTAIEDAIRGRSVDVRALIGSIVGDLADIATEKAMDAISAVLDPLMERFSSWIDQILDNILKMPANNGGGGFGSILGNVLGSLSGSLGGKSSLSGINTNVASFNASSFTKAAANTNTRQAVSVHYAPVINAQGADAAGLARVEQQQRDLIQALPDVISGVVSDRFDRNHGRGFG